MPGASLNVKKRKRDFISTNGPPPPDVLIPIRLDVTVDNHHIHETISWNPNEKHVTPKTFAAMFCADLGLPLTVQELVVEQMNEQIAIHSAHTVQQESRHVVRLDVRIGRIVIRDQFEWDLSETLNNADAFAERLCADLGLNTEHVPMVAHAVREQLVELAEFEDKRQSGPVLTYRDVIRPLHAIDVWQPNVTCLTVEEQEKLERKEKREARLQRRNRGKADIYSRFNGRPAIGRGRGSRRRAPSRLT